MEGKNDISIDGNGATFFATQESDGKVDPRNRSQWDFENMSNLLIEDMIIDGAHPDGGQDDSSYIPELEAQHGINIVGGERIEVRNITITDVYGDFVYIGRSASPVFGKPTDIYVHDVHGRRTGRQGISVTHGFNVRLEHNNLADIRRATFALEPASTTGSVRNVFIRNNFAGRGRLLFVAGHGSGDVSDIYIQNNTLHNKNMGIDFVAPNGGRRQNVVVTGNVSDFEVGNGRGAVLRFVGYDYIDVRNNVQPAQINRDMYMVGYERGCKVTVSGNDLGPYGAGQAKELEGPYDCGTTPPLVLPIKPTQFEGDRLTIDVGGNGGNGMIPCPATNNCGGYYTGGAANVLTASAGGTLAERTMLHGNLNFDIPIRSGTYNVTLTWIEPSADISDRRFHVNMDGGVRVAVSVDINREAGGTNKVVRRTYPVVVGDGVMDIDLLPGGTGANAPILSLIDIDRA
jgi:hypothetical protein